MKANYASICAWKNKRFETYQKADGAMVEKKLLMIMNKFKYYDIHTRIIH